MPGYSLQQELCSSANCSDCIQLNGFRVNFTDELIIVQLLNLSNSANYSGSVIEACEGAKDVDPSIFEEEMISQCKTEANFNESRITLSNCTHDDVAKNSTTIVMINCSTCIHLYIIGGLCSDFNIVLHVKHTHTHTHTLKKSGLGLLSAIINP